MVEKVEAEFMAYYANPFSNRLVCQSKSKHILNNTYEHKQRQIKLTKKTETTRLYTVWILNVKTSDVPWIPSLRSSSSTPFKEMRLILGPWVPDADDQVSLFGKLG